jgi:hypothetical protein
VHDHSGKILGMVMDPDKGAHVKSAAIFTRASVNIDDRIRRHPGAHSHGDSTLSTRSVNDESAPAHPVGRIEEAAQDPLGVYSLWPESAGIHNKHLTFMAGLFQLTRPKQGDMDGSISMG